MIPRECRRLAEVDFPIAEVSKYAAREKSIRYGHPSTLHLWWARRPLASSRAVLLALLLPDPCDALCPKEFIVKARKLLPRIGGCNPGLTHGDLRRALLKFIASFADWDVAVNRTYVEVGRALVKAAHGEDPPLVVDPFAGGGSIPLEALRIGCDAFASDLNPVACFILRVLLEDIPRHGPQLVDDLREVAVEIKLQAEKELADLYPKDQDGATPIAYLWARTVKCEAPRCGIEIPIFKSPWLSKKGVANAKYFRESKSGSCAILLLENTAPGVPFKYRIASGEGSVNAKPGFVEISGTKAQGSNANVICPSCHTILPGNRKNPRTRVQLADQRGGVDVLFDDNGCRIGGARLLAVVTHKPGGTGRSYRLPTDKDYEAVWRAQQRVERALHDWEVGGAHQPCPIPDETLPLMSGTFNVPIYGMTRWGDLFTVRQKATLLALVNIIRNLPVSGAVKEFLGLALSRLTDIYNDACIWEPTKTQVRHLFANQAIPMRWDFPEASAIAGQAGDFQTTLETMVRVVERLSLSYEPGTTQLADAAESPLPDGSADVWFTDPPYYFAVPYADLSDFFFVWLKRVLPTHALLRDPFWPANALTPKDRELCEMAHWDQARYAHKDKDFFEDGMTEAFAQGRRVLRDDGIGSVVFAHKTTEGWEALLSGMIRGGWTITGSWPIATELANRPRARNSAALATSVHLICRPRQETAGIGDWAGVLRELPRRVGDWMERLQTEGVRGADLVFACIGPALEIFSRYSMVETADGREVTLPEYLEKIWEVVGRSALAQVLGTEDAMARNGASGAVEEDARLTALFLWTLQSTTGDVVGSINGNGNEEDKRPVPIDEEDDEEEESSPRDKAKGFTLVFDVVRRFAQPLGIALPQWEGRVIETKKGVVRLLPITERAKQLFGEEGAHAVAVRPEGDVPDRMGLFQEALFPLADDAPRRRARSLGQRPRAGFEVSDEGLVGHQNATTLDRIHAAMLLQSSGRANALRALLKAEQERGPEFLRLANALSALYPKASEEKRLLDAMLLAVPR